MNQTKPEMKFKAGAISATVWSNQSEKGLYASVRLSRTYLDKDKSWKETNTFRENDLPKAALVLNEAYRYIQMKNQNEKLQEVQVHTA